MARIADPMKALRSLQPAINRGKVQLRPCPRYKELSIILDDAGGEVRTTYAVVEAGRIQCIVQFLSAEPVDDFPCLSLGCATMEDARNRGLASTTLAKAIDDMRAGLRKHGIWRFYVEAIVSTSNVASQKVAERVLGPAVKTGTDHFSGEPILQYLKLIK